MDTKSTPFIYQGITFNEACTDDDGITRSSICGDHLGQFMDIFQPLLTLACEVHSTCKCGISDCTNEASWYIKFPSSAPKIERQPEKFVYIVRSFERIDMESQQDIYGVFENEEDAIACFNKVLSNEKEGGYFSDDECSPFRNCNFNYMDEYHIFNDNDESDWWECDIYRTPLNRMFV